MSSYHNEIEKSYSESGNIIPLTSMLPHPDKYAKQLGTVTNLFRMKNDTVMSIGQGKAVMLVLSDSCAAFDTASNDVLFSRMLSL